jgi:hypothetical protein
MRILLIAVLALALPSPVFASRTIRTLHDDRSAAGFDRVKVNFPVGELVVQPSSDGRIHFDVDVRCKDDGGRCEEQAEEVELKTNTAGGTLKLEIEQGSSWTHRIKLRGVLLMPADLALRLEMGVGELTVNGLRDDVDIDLGVGQAHLQLREADVHTVRVASGVGDASLRVGRRHVEGSGFIGHSVSWGDGSGRARVALDLGVGESEVVLD